MWIRESIRRRTAIILIPYHIMFVFITGGIEPYSNSKSFSRKIDRVHGYVQSGPAQHSSTKINEPNLINYRILILINDNCFIRQKTAKNHRDSFQCAYTVYARIWQIVKTVWALRYIYSNLVRSNSREWKRNKEMIAIKMIVFGEKNGTTFLLFSIENEQ